MRLIFKYNIHKDARDLEVCHPCCVMSNVIVYNMYVRTYIYMQSETQQLTDGITM